MEPSEYIGKFIFVSTPALPKRPIHTQPSFHKVTGLRGDRQLRLESYGANKLQFTRLGDHIVYVCDTSEQAMAYLTSLQALQKQVSELEINFKNAHDAATMSERGFVLVQKPEQP